MASIRRCSPSNAARTTRRPLCCRVRRWRRWPRPACWATPIKTILALWRAPERLAAAAPWRGDAALVDIASFGEVGLLPARRGPDGMPAPIPLGAIAAPRGAAGSGRGDRDHAQRSRHAGAARSDGAGAGLSARRRARRDAASRADGFVDTGFACRLERDTGTLAVTGPPAGITAIGGYRFRQREIDAVVAGADPAAIIAALPDALLGQRLAGSARDRAATAAELQARGVNPLIAGAFRPRGQLNAA